MNRIHFISPFLIILFIDPSISSFSGENTGHLPEVIGHEISLKETKLFIDEQLADYINVQAKLDGADQVILIADTIMVKEKVTFKELDVIIATNYFSTEGRQVEVLPAETNRKRSGVDGKHGKEVQIIAKRVDKAHFHLPGMDGTKGSDGMNGKSGKKSEVKKHGDVSKGSPGTDGKDGGRGGNGGKLILHTQNENYQVRLKAPGGKGGAGGKGGTGGTTFMMTATKPGKPNPNPGQPNPDRPDRDIQIQNNRSAVEARQEKDGKNGKRGRGGIKGKETRKVISDKQFTASVSQYYHHDWENLNQTGWQILFSRK